VFVLLGPAVGLSQGTMPDWWAELSVCIAWSFCSIVTGHHAPLNVKSLSLLKFFMFNHVSISLFRSQSVQCPVFVLCSATADLFYL
jgi:hypothetical protein